MAPALVSDITQTPPLLSHANSNPQSQEGKGIRLPKAGTVLPKDSTPIPFDTVSISDQSRHARTVEKKEAVPAEESRKHDNQRLDRAPANVQFVYNLKGDVSIRYMDTDRRLIYQVPSELVLHLRETVSKSESSVDTKA